MLIEVKVKTRAHKNEVQKTGEGNYVVFVSAVPEKGKANEKVINLLSDYFGKPKQSIRIVHGRTSKNKQIQIL